MNARPLSLTEVPKGDAATKINFKQIQERFNELRAQFVTVVPRVGASEVNLSGIEAQITDLQDQINALGTSSSWSRYFLTMGG